MEPFLPPWTFLQLSLTKLWDLSRRRQISLIMLLLIRQARLRPFRSQHQGKLSLRAWAAHFLRRVFTLQTQFAVKTPTLLWAICFMAYLSCTSQNSLWSSCSTKLMYLTIHSPRNGWPTSVNSTRLWARLTPTSARWAGQWASFLKSSMAKSSAMESPQWLERVSTKTSCPSSRKQHKSTRKFSQLKWSKEWIKIKPLRPQNP